MGIKDTVLGWLSSTPDKEDELEDAEADELTREYSGYGPTRSRASSSAAAAATSRATRTRRGASARASSSLPTSAR